MTPLIAGFVLGLLWLQQQAQLPDAARRDLLLVAAALLALAAMGLRRRFAVRGQRFSSLSLCLLGYVCAVAWGSWRAELRLADALPAALEGEDIQISGTIAAMPQKIERGWRFDFAVDRPAPVPRLVSLAWYEPGAMRDDANLGVPPLHAGDRWQLTVRLRRPHGNLNPHGFDYEGWLFERGIRATGYVRPRAEQRLLAQDAGAYRVERSREAVRTRFEQTLGEAPYAGVLIALTVGDQQSVSLVTCKEVVPRLA